MTVGEYLRQKLQAWNVTDAQILDTGLDLESEYVSSDTQVQNALLDTIEELALAPYLKNVNENGFSVSWDYQNMGRYYLWLCNKLGRTPDDNVVAALGISTITDKSDIW